ncbi:MAG: carboxypeptidase-like regulatory domain-containing protein, partial [Planctomycetota bacterium]
MRDIPSPHPPRETRAQGSLWTRPPVLILLAIFACGASVGLQVYLKKRAEVEEALLDPNLPRPEVVQHATRRFEPAPEPEKRHLYVRGFAESSDGTALPSAHIRLGLLQGEHWTQLEHFEPQVNGSFEIDLEELAEWSPHSLIGVRLEARASAPNHQPLRVRASIPREGNEVLMNLPFQAGHSLSGQVVDNEGAPVANATVDVFLSTATDSPNSERKRSVLTDAEGR